MFFMAAFIVVIVSIYIGGLSIPYPWLLPIYKVAMIIAIFSLLIPLIGNGYILLIFTPIGLIFGGAVLIAIVLLWLFSFAGFFTGRALAKFLNNDQP